jgi:hypothetical protein
MHVQRIKTPSGEEMVILPADEFEELVGARDHAQAMAAYRRGKGEWLSSEEMADYLAASSALAFWRQRRKLTQAALAEVSSPGAAACSADRRPPAVRRGQPMR